MLATLDRALGLIVALDALETQGDLLGCLRFLVEDWLGLSTKPGLLSVVTPLPLRVVGSLSSLVLANAVQLMIAAFLAGAIGLTGLRHDNLYRRGRVGTKRTSKKKRQQIRSRRLT